MPSVSDFAVESDVWPHIASPGQGLQGGWPSRLDFCCKVTTKIFGTWLCCHLPSFAVIYFSPPHSYHARLQRIMDGKYIFARRRSDFCFSARRYARDEHSALRQRLCVMMISDINISYPAYLTSIIPPYIWAHRRATTWWNRQGHHRRAARWQQISHYGALINLSSSPITSSPPNMWISPQSPSIQGDKSLFFGWHGSEELWAVSYESWVTIQLVIALANFVSAWSFTIRNYHRFDKNLS